MPPCEIGSSLKCRLRGRLKVAGITDAPVPWPWTWQSQGGGKRLLILCGDLVRAVRTESAQAIVYHWGVGRQLVSEWRSTLGVGRMTPGTRRRWVELAPARLDRAARVRGGVAAGQARRRSAGTCPPEEAP
jgi:hypothetical protein